MWIIGAPGAPGAPGNYNENRLRFVSWTLNFSIITGVQGAPGTSHSHCLKQCYIKLFILCYVRQAHRVLKVKHVGINIRWSITDFVFFHMHQSITKGATGNRYSLVFQLTLTFTTDWLWTIAGNNGNLNWFFLILANGSRYFFADKQARRAHQVIKHQSCCSTISHFFICISYIRRGRRSRWNELCR